MMQVFLPAIAYVCLWTSDTSCAREHGTGSCCGCAPEQRLEDWLEASCARVMTPVQSSRSLRLPVCAQGACLVLVQEG